MANLPEASLVIAGNDEENYKSKLLVLAEKAGISERINYIGPIYSVDKWRLLAEASVLVLPSRSENFGNVVLEAMAVGTPVVVTSEVGISSEVIASSAGLVSNGDAENLAEKISRICDDPDRATQMGVNGRAVVKQKYDWPVIAKRMEKIYSELCEAGNR
jgi:glycosyltransferase involved in cell wall biosynthesis